MEAKLQNFFINISKINSWLNSDNLIGSKCFDIGMVIAIITGILNRYLGENYVITKIFSTIFVIYGALGLLLNYFNSGDSGENKTPLKRFNEYNHKSYSYFLIINSFIFTFIFTIIFVFVLDIIELNGYILLKLMHAIFMLISIFFSVVWFTYHFVVMKIEEKYIDEYLKLYISIQTSVQFILSLTVNNSTLILNYLFMVGIMYFWIQYIIKKIENDRIRYEKVH